MRRFQYKNIMEVPKIVKITVNIALGEACRTSRPSMRPRAISS
jgi:ribosomal protein L5